MTPYQHRGNPFGKGTEKPRSDDISWHDVAMIVYGWTDGREPGIDRAWWTTAGGCFYRVVQQIAGDVPIGPASARNDGEEPVQPVGDMAPA